MLTSKVRGRLLPAADVRRGLRRATHDLSDRCLSLPTRQDIDQNINEQLIVELYSK